MNADKDYYAILGVLPSVDAAVLQAVYRALAKKYHPDASGNSSTAAFVAIQEAYEVLGDQAKRAHYDQLRKERDENAGRYEQASDNAESSESQSSAIEEDWAIILEYEPTTARVERRLSSFSKSLALLYRTIMLERRDFKAAEPIGAALEAEFLSTYFGDNKEVQGFAKTLLIPSREPRFREAARELNRVVRTLRTPSDPEALIRRIVVKFRLDPLGRPTARPPLPNSPQGWAQVTAEAGRQGWTYIVGGEWRHENRKVTVMAETPEEAWTVMELDLQASH